MKQQEVFKKIGNILGELNDQYEYLANNKEPLNDLELELFVANAHFLSEHSEILKKLNLQNTPAEAAENPPKATENLPKPDKQEKFFEPVVQQVKAPVEPKTEPEEKPEPPAKAAEVYRPSVEEDDRPVPHIDIAQQGTEDDFSVMMPEPEIIKHELVLDESENWDDEDDRGFTIDEDEPTEEPVYVPPVKAAEPELPKPVAETKTKEEPVKIPEPVAVKPEPKKEIPATEEKTPVATEEPLTINQKMSAQLKNSGAHTTAHLHSPAITDLKQAITLNDKLLYIKDLFNGYNLAYSEAIDILNRYNSFDEADQFLQSNYAVKNQWGTKQATVDKFYALLKRRYV